MSRHSHDPELVTCRDCETKFDLARQHYYDNLCPSCKADHDGQEAIQPTCPGCGDRFDPSGGTIAQVINPGVRGGRETIMVCSTDCKEQAEAARP